MHEVHTEMMRYLQEWETVGIALEGMQPDAKGYKVDMKLRKDMQRWVVLMILNPETQTKHLKCLSSV
jgi:hypothetical protein